MKKIIEMAREAGLWPAVTDTFPKELQAFAALVRANEREACAKLAEEWLGLTKDRELHIAAAIRARGQPEERNFCQRCGKRTADLTTIHTCTPPQENT